MRGQALVPPRPEAVDESVRRASGLQAQDIFAASLGVRARSQNATLDDVEDARFTARSVVWTWAMRGTLHLIATEDLDWLLPAIGPTMIAATRRRRAQLHLDDESYARGLRLVRDYLGTHGSATREELGRVLDAGGLPSGYSAERYLLHRAALEGVVCAGEDRGPTQSFVLLEDWLGRALKPTTTETALSELVSRYLAAYAPATLADLATWSGVPIATLRPHWNAVMGRLVEVAFDGQRGWLPAERLAEDGITSESQPHVCLLPPFDTYLLGHKDRGLAITPDQVDRIRAGGIIRAVIVVNGLVVGTWHPNRKGRRVNVSIDPFSALPEEVLDRVAAEIADIGRFLGESPRSPA